MQRAEIMPPHSARKSETPSQKKKKVHPGYLDMYISTPFSQDRESVVELVVFRKDENNLGLPQHRLVMKGHT